VNKEGKADKARGEIEVSLQFYSKNNQTGSVLDLATKKKTFITQRYQTFIR